MRITFILPTVNLSGGIRVIGIYAQFLVDFGHEVTLISPPQKRISFRRKIRSVFAGTGWPRNDIARKSHLDNTTLNHQILKHSNQITDAEVPNADVVIATWWNTAEWVNNLSASKGAKVYFIQGHEVFPHLPVERCHATYRMPLHKIVIARWLKDLMLNSYGDSMVDLVSNSVDRRQFFAPPREKQLIPTVGFVYSPVDYKGMDTVLAALELVRTQFTSLRIICFGSKTAQPKFPLPTGTEFHLSPPQHSIRDLYAQCDVWIASSKGEGFYLPAMEAMACRTPVVSTKIGWPAEAIRSEINGVLVEIGDINGLASGVKWVLSLPNEDWKKLSLNAFETASTGSWQESAKLFESALFHACSRAGRGEISGQHSLTQTETA